MTTAPGTPDVDNLGYLNINVRFCAEWGVRIVVGMFLIALLNCFLIGAAIQYIQVRILRNIRISNIILIHFISGRIFIKVILVNM